MWLTEYPAINVRRKLYKPITTAGKGVKWEWLSVIDSEWHMYNMDVQNVIEDAWSKVSVVMRIVCSSSSGLVCLYN